MALDKNWKCVFQVDAPGDDLRCLPSPDGLIVAAWQCSLVSRALYLWDTQDGTLVHTLELESYKLDRHNLNRLNSNRYFYESLQLMSLRDVVFSVDGALLFSVSGLAIRIWDIDTGKQIHAATFRETGQPKFSQAGELLAVGAAGGVIKLLDPRSGKLIRTLQTSLKSTVKKMVFSRDCKRLLTYGESGNDEIGQHSIVIIVCDVETGKVIHEISIEAQTFNGNPEWILDIAISPNDQFLAVRTALRIILYEVETGIHQCTIQHNSAGWWEWESFNFPLLSFSRYSDIIAGPDGSFPWSSRITLWEVKTGEEISSLYHNPGDFSGTFGVVFAPSGQVLYSINNTGKSLKAWKPPTLVQEPILIVSNNMHSVNEIAFSPNGKILASRSSKSSDRIKLWDIASGQAVYSFTYDLNQLKTSTIFFGCPLLFSQDGTTLVCDGFLWDIEMHHVTGVRAHLLPFDDKCNIHDDDSESYLYTTVSPDLQISATSDKAGDSTWGEWKQISFWDIPTQRKVSTLIRSDSTKIREVYEKKLSPDGKIFARLVWLDMFYNQPESDEAIELWDTHTGEKICSLALPQVEITGDNKYRGNFTFSWDSRILASNLGCPYKKVVVLSDTKTGHPLCQFSGLVKIKDRFNNAVNRVVSLAFSPDNQTLAIGDFCGNIVLWQLSTDRSNQIKVRKIQTFSNALGNSIDALVFSPDGQTLASGTNRSNAAIVLWDVESGMKIQSFPGHLESF